MDPVSEVQLTDKQRLGSHYVTDANGLELMKRDVFVDYSASFSSSFYPVNTMISAFDRGAQQAFSVWIDRPQAGSVHETGGLKLLIDRRVASKDNGGIPQEMQLYDFEDDKLVLNFSLLP